MKLHAVLPGLPVPVLAGLGRAAAAGAELGGAAAGTPQPVPVPGAGGQWCSNWGRGPGSRGGIPGCVTERRAGGFKSLPVRFTLESISR